MYDIRITFSRNKDFEQESVKKIIYTNVDGSEITVEGTMLLTHQFPIRSDLGTMLICSDGFTSSVAWKDVRSISIFEPEDL